MIQGRGLRVFEKSVAHPWSRLNPLDVRQEAEEFRSVAANARQVAQARWQERAMQAQDACLASDCACFRE